MIGDLSDYIISLFSRFVRRYSYLWGKEYYQALVDKFYPFDGNFRMFLAGVIYVVIVFLAVHPHGDEEDEDMNILEWFYIFPGESTLQFLRTMLVISIINCSAYLCEKILPMHAYDLVHKIPVNNLLSLFLLVLIVHSWYAKHRIRAFFFGIAVYLLPVFTGEQSLLFSSLNKNEEDLLIIELIVGAIVCIVSCSLKYFYTSWIWCLVMYVNFEVLGSVLMEQSLVLSNEMIFGFLMIFVIALFFERVVIGKKQKSV